jgi:hypothetical protein
MPVGEEDGQDTPLLILAQGAGQAAHVETQHAVNQEAGVSGLFLMGVIPAGQIVGANDPDFHQTSPPAGRPLDTTGFLESLFEFAYKVKLRRARDSFRDGP